MARVFFFFSRFLYSINNIVGFYQSIIGTFAIFLTSSDEAEQNDHSGIYSSWSIDPPQSITKHLN